MTTRTANLEGSRHSLYRNGLPMQSHGMMQRATLAPFATIRMAGINRAQTRSRAGLRLSQSTRLNRGLLFGGGGGGNGKPCCSSYFLSWRDNPLVSLGLHPHSRGLFFLDHKQRHTTVGRTPLDE